MEMFVYYFEMHDTSKPEFLKNLRRSSNIPGPSAVFTVRLCLQCVCTCPVALGCEFRRVDDPVDGGLSDGVLLLQQLDGLPQLVQLGVLRAQTVAGQIRPMNVQKKEKVKRREAALTFCSAVSVRLFSLMVMLPRLCSNAATK